MCDCHRNHPEEIEVKTIYEVESDQEVELEIGEMVIEDDEMDIDVDLEDDE